MSRTVYVASSGSNDFYPTVVAALRNAGHEVYDFRNQETAFRWEEIVGAAEWPWTVEQYRAALDSRVARRGFNSDYRAISKSDTCVLVNPAGISAHMELAYSAALGKDCYVLGLPHKPELMYLFCSPLPLVRDLSTLVASLGPDHSPHCKSDGLDWWCAEDCPWRRRNT